MIALAELWRLCRKVPFTPFTVVMRGGYEHRIEGPAALSFSLTRPGTAGFRRPGGSWVFFDLADVAGIVIAADPPRMVHGEEVSNGRA